MCQIALQLLAEKLLEDFYEDYIRTRNRESLDEENLAERLKAQLPTEQYELLYRWEAVYAEHCGAELWQFADFVV